MRVVLAICAAVCTAAGCIPSEGPMMRPGQDCLECHDGGEGPAFTAAGTVFTNAGDDPSQGVRAARILLTDASGRTLTLRSNDAGNFYTREKLAFPLQVSVERDGVVAVMSEPAPEGGCNKCHTVPPPASQLPNRPAGRVALLGGSGDEFMLPGADCVSCHRTGGAAQGHPFTAAGTVYTNPLDAPTQGVQGVTIHLTDASGHAVTLTSNRVGNFFTSEPLTFPLTASIESGGTVAAMASQLPEGGCNKCHNVPAPPSQLPLRPVGRVALVGGSLDEFMLPGYDCQSCHSAGGAASAHPWNASGTVFTSRSGTTGDAGVTVTIVDAQGRTFQRVTNRVGNFYMPDSIVFGGSARVTISKGGVTRTMDERLPHGSCNACHRPGGEGEGRVSLTGG